MFALKSLPEFSAWLGKIQDPVVKATLVARLKRLERGLPGDVEPAGMVFRNYAYISAQGGASITFSSRQYHRVACWRNEANAKG